MLVILEDIFLISRSVFAIVFQDGIQRVYLYIIRYKDRLDPLDDLLAGEILFLGQLVIDDHQLKVEAQELQTSRKAYPQIAIVLQLVIVLEEIELNKVAQHPLEGDHYYWSVHHAHSSGEYLSSRVSEGLLRRWQHLDDVLLLFTVHVVLLKALLNLMALLTPILRWWEWICLFLGDYLEASGIVWSQIAENLLLVSRRVIRSAAVKVLLVAFV